MAEHDIFIIGHGGYDPVEADGSPTRFTVPENCEVRFYVALGVPMEAGMIRGWLEVALIKCHERDPGGMVSSSSDYKPLNSAPNMVLAPLKGTIEADKCSWLQGKPIFARRGLQTHLLVLKQERGNKPHLSTIVKNVNELRGVARTMRTTLGPGDYVRFHWLCCRTVIPPPAPRPMPAPQPVVAAASAPAPFDPFAGIEIDTFS